MKKIITLITIINVIILISLTTSQAFAGTCFDKSCHISLTKPKHIHGPIAAEMAGSPGCIACHRPAGSICSKRKTGAFIFTKDDKEMCLLCHGKVNATEHTNNQKTCLNCHDPHGSDESVYMLRKK